MPPRCDRCSGIVRPRVVLFDAEDTPRMILEMHEGQPRLVTYDADGKLLERWPPEPTQ